MKNKIVAAVAVLGVAVMAGGCTSGAGISSEVAEADPWVEVDSLEEAEEGLGFELTVPDMSDYGEEEVYRVCVALMEIEIQYVTDGEQGAYIRKAADDGDISGDYDKYAYEEEVAVGENTVTFKGASEGEINLAVWNAGDYAYCVGIPEGVSSEVMNELVSGVE